jgi:hypothetical protein
VVREQVGTGNFDEISKEWQIATMVKTQIQFPDHLYREAKRVVAEYEMSFAEVVRRGVEQVIKLHPSGRNPAHG